MLLASFSCRLNLCPGIGRTSSRRGNTRGQSSSDLYLDGETHPVTDPVSLVGGDRESFADRQVSYRVPGLLFWFLFESFRFQRFEISASLFPLGFILLN